jgi:nucleotide-binding universal stress UspA family protein
MFRKIMIPVDLAHAEKLERALSVATDLAKHYEASACLVGVTAPQPSEVAHNPQEYEQELAAFAGSQSAQRGLAFEHKAITSHDPAIELDEALQDEAHRIGADLIVMASHVPGFMEHIVSSYAGYLASHTELSVFVVR